MSAVAQPSGTVTLVFSDIEGSTRLLEELGVDAYREALAEHRRVVREACSRHQGYEVDYEGDAFFYAFASAQAALSAVSEAMVGLQAGPIRIRVGIHTGEPGLDPPKYVGMDVHRAARIMSAAHGGQVVLSPSTVSLLEPESFELRDLGEHRFKDIEGVISIFQLGDGSFPPLKTISNTNLPRPASSFVGRERELADVLTRVEGGARLVTSPGREVPARRGSPWKRPPRSSPPTRQASSGSGSPRSAIPCSSPRRSRRRSVPRTVSPSTSPSASCSSSSTTSSR